MKKMLIIFLLILISPTVFAKVLIQEVLYDPISSENDGEAIVLFNDGEEVDVSGWVLATKASSKDATIPQNTFISTGGYLLIADTDFSLNKDDSSWPDPNYEETLTMGNSDAGVALLNGETVMDRVGWGNPEIITLDFYDGNPHSGVSEGESLRRISDTNNNLQDFVAGTPVFFKENNLLKEIIEINITIKHEAIEFIRFEILADDNASKSGVQIKPKAGEKRKFDVEFEIKNNQNFSTAFLFFNDKKFEVEKRIENETSIVFKGTVSISYYKSPNKYELKAVVKTIEEEFSKVISFEYLSLAAIDADTEINLEIKPGESLTKKFTVRNVGNEDLLLKIKGQKKSFLLENIKFSDSILTNEFQTLKTLSNGQEIEVEIEIFVEDNFIPGNYNSEIIIVGEII